LVRCVLPQLCGPLLGEFLHVVLAAEMETTRGTCLDAGGLKTVRDPVRAKSAFENFFGRRIEFWNIEWASGNAVLTADAVLLVEVDDTIRILHDGAVGRTGTETAGVGTVHALVFAHEQTDAAVGVLVLVEPDQVPIIPCRLWHGLVAVVENSFGEGITIPLETGNFTGFAANAGSHIDQLANVVVARGAMAGHGSGVSRDGLDFQRWWHAASSSFFELDQKALKFRRECVGIDYRGRQPV